MCGEMVHGNGDGSSRRRRDSGSGPGRRAEARRGARPEAARARDRPSVALATPAFAAPLTAVLTARLPTVLLPILLLAALLLAVLQPAGAARAQTPAPGSPCRVYAQQGVSPSALLLGETAEITLGVTPICAQGRERLHLVLVLDASGSMQGERIRALKDGARALVDDLDPERHSGLRIGVVSFNSTATVHCQLGRDEASIKRCIDGIAAEGSTSISRGIIAGIKVFQQGRRDVPDPDALREVMLVVTDGEDNAGCGPVIRAAGQVTAQGILLVSVCVTEACDEACLRAMANSPRYFFQADEAAQLRQVLQRIGEDVLRSALASLELVTTLPPALAFVTDSARPPLADLQPAPQRLVWRADRPPTESLAFTFRVRPTTPGRHALSDDAWGSFTDMGGQRGVFEVPPGSLVAIGRSSPPAPHRSATPTARPTATPTRRATAAGWPTGLPAPRAQLHLPALLRPPTGP